MQLTEEEKSIIKDYLDGKGKRRKDEVKLDNNLNHLLDEIPERMYNEMINDMETKEFKIQVPEGYEIDKENSTFECIKFKPIKKNMTYEDVAKRLFEKETYYVDYNGDIVKTDIDNEVVSLDSNNCTSEKQAEKLLSINKLMNVAKYLNGDWNPNFDKGCDTELKYFIAKANGDNFIICNVQWTNDINVFFKSYNLAEKAIEILGEETIKTALSTEW